MSEVFKHSAPVKTKACVSRPLSPQPSTSSAPVQPVVTLKTNKNDRLTQILDSVYSHVEDNFRLNDIGQLTGLRSSRRRGRWRKLYQAKLAYKFAETIKQLEPMIKEEIVKQQSQHVLIASALDHFANTVNEIADLIEGKKDSSDFSERLEAFKKKLIARREKRRAENPNAPEFANEPPPAPKLSEEEIERRLREETQAAIEALSTGDKSKETLPDIFANFLETFKKT